MQRRGILKHERVTVEDRQGFGVDLAVRGEESDRQIGNSFGRLIFSRVRKVHVPTPVPNGGVVGTRLLVRRSELDGTAVVLSFGD